MNSVQPNRVSVIDPVTPAIDRVKLMLFKPFDLGRWFVIGFCAWLSGYRPFKGGGGGRGGGPQYNMPPGQLESIEQIREQLKEFVESARYYVSNNLFWIIPVTVTVITLSILIGFLVAWLSSRGRFMFLHCVATNKAEVLFPWRKFRHQGNSLFLFRIVLGIISFVVLVPLMVGIVVSVFMWILGSMPGLVLLQRIAILGLITFVLYILLFLVRKFTFDFVVPIMSLRMVRCIAGWREFMAILSANKFRFALYLLFQIVITIVIWVMKFIGFCIGLCFCCVSCLLLVPYIGTVILLPIWVFTRSYSLYYLQQYGLEFDVFRTEVEAVDSV